MKPGIVAFAPGVWGWPHFAGSPRYHLWTLAGMGWPVLYVEPPVRLRARAETWQAPDRPFHVLKPALVPPFAVSRTKGELASEAWRRVVSSRLASQAATWVEQLSIQPDIIWCGAPWQGLIPARFAKSRVVHFVYDELSLSPIMSPAQAARLDRWEEELNASADLVLCSSEPQRVRRAGRAKGTVELLENCISDGFLAGGETPSEPMIERMKALPKPVVAYGGVADLRLDPALFTAILREGRIGSLAMLGVRDALLDGDLAQELDSDSRVAWFGSIPYLHFPRLYAMADVLVLAHRRHPFTDAMLSEKLIEYLSTGKPIVSIDLPEARRLAAEAGDPRAIRVASTPAEFAASIREASAESDPEIAAVRRDMAAKRTWSRAGQRLAGLLDRL